MLASKVTWCVPLLLAVLLGQLYMTRKVHAQPDFGAVTVESDTAAPATTSMETTPTAAAETTQAGMPAVETTPMRQPARPSMANVAAAAAAAASGSSSNGESMSSESDSLSDERQ